MIGPILVFVSGAITGILVLFFIAIITTREINTSSTIISKEKDLGQLPARSKFFGGAEEKVILLERPELMTRVLNIIQWEAANVGLPHIDFFTFETHNPERVIAGRKYRVGDMIENEIVVMTDGIKAVTMPSHQALSHLSREIAKASAEAYGTNLPEINERVVKLRSSYNELDKRIRQQEKGAFKYDTVKGLYED